MWRRATTHQPWRENLRRLKRRPLFTGELGAHKSVGMSDHTLDLLDGHIGVEADAGVLLAQDFRQMRVSFQADGLDTFG